ncbi:MAG: ribonuclease P protein component [Bacteroidales bacterium]|nr:ribonuclease P protein component [Bacteroidales bacterium]
MPPFRAHTLSKAERLCGKKDIARLLDQGRYGTVSCFRYCCLRENGQPVSRILVSVPKRSFKRAVKRNLLKRRIREAYRLQKQVLGPGNDIMFIYTPREILPFADIFAAMAEALAALT